MVLDDARYLTRRALTQLDCASRAADADIEQVHLRMSDLYLERARDSIERELRTELHGTVIPFAA